MYKAGEVTTCFLGNFVWQDYCFQNGNREISWRRKTCLSVREKLISFSLSVFKQNVIYKYEGELWPQSIQVNVPDSVIKNSMDAPELKAS